MPTKMLEKPIDLNSIKNNKSNIDLSSFYVSSFFLFVEHNFQIIFVTDFFSDVGDPLFRITKEKPETIYKHQYRRSF